MTKFFPPSALSILIGFSWSLPSQRSKHSVWPHKSSDQEKSNIGRTESRVLTPFSLELVMLQSNIFVPHIKIKNHQGIALIAAHNTLFVLWMSFRPFSCRPIRPSSPRPDWRRKIKIKELSCFGLRVSQRLPLYTAMLLTRIANTSFDILETAKVVWNSLTIKSD